MADSRVVRVAGAAGAVLRALLLALPVLRALLGLALIGYGAWLWWPPAGFMAVGVLLVADQLLPEREPAAPVEVDG